MNFKFDAFNQYDIPSFILCNPNKDQLYAMGDIYDRQVKLRFNAISEINFTCKSKIFSNEIEIATPYFDLVDYRRLVYIENLGYFMITQIDQSNDGMSNIKKVTANSLEVELNFKKIFISNSTLKFWDLFDTGKTLLGLVLEYLPDWNVGYVDASLNSVYRTFVDINDLTLYEFLTKNVSEAYQAIFTFDTVNKEINAYTTITATTPTDIVIGYDNLLENTDIKPIIEELVTVLSVYGGGNLGINLVNPIGNSNLYNYDYYKTTDWMSGSLITALNNWEVKVSASQVNYATLLTQRTVQNTNLLNTQSYLATLQGELDELTNIQSVRIQGNVTGTYMDSDGNLWGSINEAIISKNVEITITQSSITSQNLLVTTTGSALSVINNNLSFANNFTQDQYLELDRFSIGSTYNNPNFIMTDSMTASAIQLEAQDLYNLGQEVLTKISEPRYTFTINSINFIFLKEFQEFSNQIEPGCTMTIEFEDDRHVVPVLLEMSYNYDNPTEFGLTFSNRMRLDDSAFQFSDLFNQSISSGITTSFNSQLWSNWNNNYKDDVSTFITSALDASKNAVINAKNQNLIIDSSGMRGRYLDPATGEYGNEQFWMINNMLVFTDNNWNTAKLALGKITTPTSGSAYGLIQDFVQIKDIKFKNLNKKGE